MASPERSRVVDDSSNINPESRLHQGDTDDGEIAHSSTLGPVSAAGSSLAPSLPPMIEPSPQDHLPVFHHLDEGGLISKIDSLRDSQNENVDIQSEGLYLVSSPTEQVKAEYDSTPYFHWRSPTKETCSTALFLCMEVQTMAVTLTTTG